MPVLLMAGPEPLGPVRLRHHSEETSTNSQSRSQPIAASTGPRGRRRAAYGKAATLGGFVVAGGQSGDAVALQTAVQRAAGRVRDAVLEAAHDIVGRHQRAAPEFDDDGLLGRGEYGTAWRGRLIG